jgi:hypothetical protein
MAELSPEALRELGAFVESGRMGPAGPAISAFSVAESHRVGDAVEVRWATEGARSIRLLLSGEGRQEAREVGARGALRFEGLPIGEYRLEIVAEGDEGVADALAHFDVRERAPLLAARLDSPIYLMGSAPLRLHWQSERAAEVRLFLDGMETQAGPAGVAEVAPDSPGFHTLVLVALGPGGAERCVLRIEARAPAVALHVEATAAAYGEPARVSWRAAGARSLACSFAGRASEPVPLESALVLPPLSGRVVIEFIATAWDGAVVARRVCLEPALVRNVTAQMPLPAIARHLALQVA